MLFDSHAHLNFKAFDKTWPDVIADCVQKGVVMVNVGAQLETTRKAIQIADRYESGVYAAVGLHPIHTPGGSSNPEEFDFDEYKALASSSKKVVAVGETGIDFFHDETNVASQAEVFKQHIRLAKELDLAVIIHGRNSRDGRKNAYAKIYEIVKAEGISRAVVHCYGGTWEEAQRFVDLGLKIGFTGIITFPKTQSLADIARRLSAEQILIETDCPYLAPEPHRGQQNMPQYVRFVAEKIAEIRGISYNEIAEQTRRNAEVLFNIS